MSLTSLTSESIRSLYALNLLEGEGLGTSYEYYVKLRRLKRFILSVGPPKKILIAGLPERYGLSLDFFLLGRMLCADVFVVDERSERLDKAKSVLEILKRTKAWRDNEVTFMKVEDISDIAGKTFLNDHFDLSLSCEVLQRLEGSQKKYVSGLMKVSSNFSLFVPNEKNQAHTRISALKGIRLDELVSLIQSEEAGIQMYDHGYIDIPPFPPGVSRSQKKREKASKSWAVKTFMKGLEIYSHLENMLPSRVKEKQAHIVYVMVSCHQ